MFLQPVVEVLLTLAKRNMNNILLCYLLCHCLITRNLSILEPYDEGNHRLFP